MQIGNILDTKMVTGAGVSLVSAASLPTLVNEWAAAFVTVLAGLSAAVTLAYTLWKWRKESKRRK